MYKCINCKWQGEELSVRPLTGKCPICGDNVTGNVETPKKEELVKEELDLNNDGKVDEADAKIASKVMNIVKGRKSRKNK